MAMCPFMRQGNSDLFGQNLWGLMALSNPLYQNKYNPLNSGHAAV